MIRKLVLPAVATLGIAVAGCEEYEAPEIPNSGPKVTVDGITAGASVSDSIKLVITASDDKYTNSLGIFLYNKDEENSLEYGYGFARTSINKPEVKLNHKLSVLTKRVVDGNYDLVVESVDVQGLSDKKVFPITVAGGASNVDTITTFKIEVWDSSAHKALSPFFSIKDMKPYSQASLRSATNLPKIDIVLARINGTAKFFSQAEAKKINAAEKFTAKDSLGTKEVSFVLTTLAPAQVGAVKTSTEIRKIYNDQIALTPATSAVDVSGGKVYALKTETGVYALLHVGFISGTKSKITGYFKRFYP